MESKISKTLSERTTRMVIILILSMLFCMPLFQSDTYLSSITSFEIGLNSVVYIQNQYTKNSQEFKTALAFYVDDHNSLITPLIQVTINEVKVYQSSQAISKLRMDEFESVLSSDDSAAVYDVRTFN